MIRTFGPLGVLASTWLLLACQSPATGLVVRVDSDFDVPAELSAVEVEVRDETGAVVSSRSFALAPPSSTLGRDEISLPFSLGVAPRDGDASRAVEIVVTGVGPDGADVLTRRARTGFVEGQTLLLDMFLARSCRGVTCTAEQTCTERGCARFTIPPASLPSIRRGDELDAGHDAGHDAGLDLDASLDAGAPRDAGVDGSEPADGAVVGTVRYVRVAATASCDSPLSAAVPAIAAGRTTIVTVAYRGGSPGAVTVTDTRGNAYTLALPVLDENPRIAIFTSYVTTPLLAGDTIEATYPDGSTVAMVIDELEGVSRDLPVSNTSRGAGSGRELTLGATTTTRSFVYAAVATGSRTELTAPSEWTPGGSVSAACGGAPGNMALFTFHQSAEAGDRTITGDLASSVAWSALMLVLSPQ